MKKSEVLAWLKKNGSRRVIESMERYGIPSKGAVGVSVGELQKFTKQVGKDHKLAAELWASGVYEARLLATLIDDPKQVTVGQMNRWAADFDSWAVCDSACFWLFDRSPLAWRRVPQWTKSPREYVKRGGFALMACLALHDKNTADEKFLSFLPLIEKGADDERNFVKKGVSWGLRSIARRSPVLNAAAVKLAARLAARADAASRWVGKDALRDLEKVRKKRVAKAKSKFLGL
jgi:3-methyladenine DNA glycosylase AlkD